MNLGDRIKGFSPVAARLPPFCFCFDGVRTIAAFGDDSPRLIDRYSMAACESAGFEFRVLHSGRLTAGSAGRTIFRADQHSRILSTFECGDQYARTAFVPQNRILPRRFPCLDFQLAGQ